MILSLKCGSIYIALKCLNITPNAFPMVFIQQQTINTQPIFNRLINQFIRMFGSQSIPQGVKKVISLLNNHGLQYESTLLEAQQPYEFLYPKSKYYRYYTNQLYENGPTSRQRLELRMKKDNKEYIKIQGNLQSISVGAMVEIIKNQLAENNRNYYQPFENEFYEENIELAHKNQNVSNKIHQIIRKHSHLIAKKLPTKQKQKEKDKKDNKLDQIRKQAGTYNDGSLGAYGGKKYQGLGVRDQFDAFRRERSQNYYSSMHQKLK